MKVTVLNPFTLDRKAHSSSSALICDDPSLTVQADVEQSDINTIVKQFGLTHELPYGLAVPEYFDATDAPSDYHAAMNYIRESDSVFMEMPAEIRSRFDNDAGRFLEFVRDPENYSEASKMGLVPPVVSSSETPSTDGLPTSADGSSPADAGSA